MARIELRDLAHTYAEPPADPPDWALRPTRVTFEDGGAFALLGPSGCGKTTLLNIISGLLTPSLGSVFYDDRDVTALDTAERNIAQVFQFPVIYDTMTVAQNLAFPLRNRGVPADEIQRKVAEVADMLDLESVLHQRARGLSADRKQKISMGRGLVRDDVAAILFDEPLTVIDPFLKWQLRRKLKEVHARFRHTLLYVTHDQNEAMTFADRVMVMNEGELLQIGTPQELFEAPAHRFVGWFIGSPGMNFLPCRIEEGGLVIEGTRMVLGGRWHELALAHATARLEIGIRPDFLAIHDEHESEGAPIQILKVEDLGNFRLVTVGFGPHAVKVRVPQGRPIPADLGRLAFDPDHTLLYADDRLIG